MATEKQDWKLNGWTEEEIRAYYREMERRTKEFQEKLGFIPDLEDWEEYE